MERASLLRFVATLALLALMASATTAQNDCKGSAGGNNYDLSPLAGQVLTTADPNGQKYSYKVCGFVDTPGCRTATDSTPAVCQQDTNQNYHDCGSQSTAQWGSSADGATLSFSGGEGGRSAVITFRCDSTATTPAFIFLSQGPSGIAYSLQVTSQYACPAKNGGGGGGGGGGKSDDDGGISGGWIFIIVLSSLLVLYIVGGVAFNKFYRHHEGKEIIPNVDFWLALPGLVKDGHVFVYRKVRRLVGGSSYQEM